MRLSVVVPVYNHLDKVLACLYSLRTLALDKDGIEYLVQDDASPEYVGPSAIQPELANVERNDKNLGFPGNANRGATRAAGDVVFFVNQDVYALWGLSDAWDQALRLAFDDSAIGIVGARLLFPGGAVQSAGGEFDADGQPYHRSLGQVRNPDQSGHPFRANSDSVPEESGHRSGRIRTPFRSESGQFPSGPGIAC